jgi:hypothetical protein
VAFGKSTPDPDNARDFTKRDEVRATNEGPVSERDYARSREASLSLEAIVSAEDGAPGWLN